MGPDVSSVRVFAVTLKVSPASLGVSTGAPAWAFYVAERLLIRAVVWTREEEYEVAWDFADTEGKRAASGKRSLSLVGGGREEAVEVPVEVPPCWYTTCLRLRPASGPDVVDHCGSFVLLQADTRKAGFESLHGAGGSPARTPCSS